MVEIDIDGVIHPVSAEFIEAGMKKAEDQNASLILIQLSTPGGLDTSMREIIEHMLERSGLVDFYRTEKEGAERIENLEELVNAAEAFVTQEGFGKDAVALPVDDILNEAVNVMERYIGHDADVVERLQKILRNARDIKLVIQKVGEKMTRVRPTRSTGSRRGRG